MISLGKYFIGAYFLGCMLLAGCTKDAPSASQKDAFIKCFGGAYENDAMDMVTDKDNYYVLGNSLNAANQSQIKIAKTDNYGNRIWENTYAPEEKQTLAYQIIKLEKQAGFAIIGAIELDTDASYFETYFFIIDENGDILEENTYQNLEFNDVGKCIAELENGGFSVSVLSESANGGSTTLLSFYTLNAQGDPIRKPSSISGTDIYQICKKTNNEGYYVTGYSTHPIIIIVKPDGQAGGQVANFASIAGKITGIRQDASGSTFVCGRISSGINLGNDGFIAQLEDVEESTEYVWLKEFGSSRTDYLESLVITENNDILAIGSTEDVALNTSDIWVLKCDQAGNLISEMTMGGANNELGVRISEEKNNQFLLAGTMYFEKNRLISLAKSKFE